MPTAYSGLNLKLKVKFGSGSFLNLSIIGSLQTD
jgi:hypothetical protein